MSDYYGMEDELGFGKHKGKTVAEVLDEDPSYIKWAIENNVTAFDDEVLDELADCD